MEGVGEAIKSNLRVFKDKKLDRLWEKAKAASGTSGKGMSDEELAVLKREFQHYQGKNQVCYNLKTFLKSDTGVATLSKWYFLSTDPSISYPSSS